MPCHRSVSIPLAFLAALLFMLPPAVFAEREGTPYRGPKELSGAGGSDSGDTGTEGGTEGGGSEGGGSEGGGSEGGGSEGGGGDTGTPAPAPTPGGGTGGVTKAASIDGNILWSWWWEHNKDRFLARATERGRVSAGSVYYWLGAGAKYPPRQIVSVSDAQRTGVVFDTLKKMTADKPKVRAEAYIALGRLASVPAPEDQRKEGQPNNLVVRVLIHGVEKEPPGSDERHSAILGLGMTGDPEAGAYLLRAFDTLSVDEKAYAAVAFGLARHGPAIGLLVDSLPSAGRGKPTNLELGAIHALGLYGPEAVPEMNLEGRDGIEKLEKLASSRQASDPVIMQAVATLGRLQQGLSQVDRVIDKSRSVDVEWTAILALANYSYDEDDAEKASKELMKRAGKGKGQSKNFAVLALGDLASRLDPNSKVRAKILKFLHGKDALDANTNYSRGCAAVALGVAQDRTAIDAIAELLTDTKVDDYVIGAACVGLGLLRATDQADLLLNQVLRTKRWNPDARGYGLVGLALMGDTTRMPEIQKFRLGNQARETERQLPLAVGILGDQSETRNLVGYFRKGWKSKDAYMISNAAFGLTWIRDQSAVDQLAQLATQSSDESVRAMATIALGYVGMRARINPLTRCFENISHRNRFGGWGVLDDIAGIL